MSLINLDARHSPFQYRGITAASLGQSNSIQEHPHEDNSRDPTISSSEGRANSSDAPLSLGSAPALGEWTALLVAPNSKDANKRKKPKNNMTKSNSSFISRVIVNESLSKRIQERPTDGTFAFANINRAFQWLDMSASNKVGLFCLLAKKDSWARHVLTTRRPSISPKCFSPRRIVFVMM